MKGKFLLFLLVLQFPVLLFCQKKPTIMILPNDNWCYLRFYTTSYYNQGVKEQIPNYQQAFKEDPELHLVISKVGELLNNNGYWVKDAEQQLKNLSERTAEDNVTFSKTSGAQLAETPLDILKKRAKADIILLIDWSVNRVNKGKTVTFSIEAFDTYTSKRIATAIGTSEVSDKEVPVLLQTAVADKMSSFDQQLSRYFKSIKSSGREILLTIKVWDSWDKDLEIDYEGDELISYIEKWVGKNTVKGKYNLSDASEYYAQFEQVMIPIKDSSGSDLDARGFAKQLQKYLSQPPFNITAKIMIRGLNEAILVLGEK